MKKLKKMNILFKISFILMCICIALLITAIVVAYVLLKPSLSAIFTGSGCVLAFAGIILAMLSKPKKEKPDESNDLNDLTQKDMEL